MASVQSMTLARLLTLEADTVIGGHIDGSGDLILEQHDGSTINAGTALAAIPDASTTVKGKVELATDAETVTGTDTVRAVTPSGVAAAVAAAAVPSATTAVQGKVELATDAETVTGTDTARATTPASVAAALAAYVPSASTTVQGKVELTTSAEVATGTDTTRAVTVAGLAALPAAGGKRTTNQLVATGTGGTDITLPTEEFDNAAMFTANNAFITIPTGGNGLYRVSAWLLYSAGAPSAGWRRMAISKNNGTTTNTDSWHVLTPSAVGADSGLALTLDLPLVATDTIRIKAWHTQGADLNVTGARLSVIRLLRL